MYKRQGLERLFRAYRDRGFQVLGFPSNQFGAQEPGSAAQIGAFCEKNYGVTFPIFSKIDVNGRQAHPLYRFLKAVSYTHLDVYKRQASVSVADLA